MTIASAIAPEVSAPLDLEAEIGELLDALSHVQVELLDLLALKREALARGDLPRLAELQPQEELLAGRLAACHERRTRLLAQAREAGLPGESVAGLANRLEGSQRGPLGERVKLASSRLRLLHHHSLANWVLAQRSLLHVSQLIEIVATGGRLQPTYGDKESVHARGALVNQEA